MDRDAKNNVWIFLALIFGTLLLYWPTGSFYYVNYDDPVYLVRNSHVNQGFKLSELGWCFQAGYTGNWHPLTWLSLMLDCQLLGLRPAGHHLMNALIHALNAGLLFLVLQRMTKTLWPSAMVAALFAWHPLHVESVAWIAERKDVLCAFFFFFALLAYVEYVKGKTLNSQPSTLNYFLALFFFACALMSKPMAVTLPFVLLLVDWWPLGRIADCGSRIADWRRLIVEKIPFFALSAASCVVTMIAQERGGAVSSLERIPVQARLINAVVSYFTYIQKTVWPKDLAVIYPFALWKPGIEVIELVVVLLLISWTAAQLWKTRPYWAMGWLWFLGTLVPAIGLVQVGAQGMADRYSYIPSIGLFIIIVWEARDMAKNRPHSRLILGTLAAAALAACIVLTHQQIKYWRNSGTLFQHALAVTRDNYVAHANYAAFLFAEDKPDEAVKECRETLRIAPDYTWAYLFLGKVFTSQGKLDEARTAFAQAGQLQPRRPELPEALETLAIAYADHGRFEEAAEVANKAGELALADGDRAMAEKNLELRERYRAHR